MLKRTIICLSWAIMTIFCFTLANAEEESKKTQDSFLSKFKENLVFKKEIILGGMWSQERDKLAGKQSVGFEVLKKLSGEGGDWATILFQLRFVRYDNQFMYMNDNKMPYAHIDGEDDWELELHDAYFKYTGNFKGKLNFRIGHFDVPFGLEENVDTHSTLVQLMSMRNVGFKKDWGISMDGQFPRFDYDFAFTRGTGVEYRDRGENYLLSGRIGTPADENFSVGISGLYGEPIDTMGVMRGKKMGMMGNPNTWFGSTTKPGDDIIRRWRVGADSIYLYGPFTFKGEVSYGEDVNQDVVNTVAELDYLFPDQKMEAIAQFQYAYQDITASGGKDDIFGVLGFNYKFSPYVTLQTTYRHDFSRLKKTDEDEFVSVQLYCYW